MADKKALGLLETGIEVRQPFHNRRPRHDDKARIGARAKHERLALADDARHVGLRSLRDSDWLTKCANMVNGWLMLQPPLQGEAAARSAAGGAVQVTRKSLALHCPTPRTFGARPSPCRGG